MSGETETVGKLLEAGVAAETPANPLSHRPSELKTHTPVAPCQASSTRHSQNTDVESQSATSFKTMLKNVEEACRRKNESHTVEKSDSVNPVFIGDDLSMVENLSNLDCPVSINTEIPVPPVEPIVSAGIEH